MLVDAVYWKGFGVPAYGTLFHINGTQLSDLELAQV
jgi:hypothetical protein